MLLIIKFLAKTLSVLNSEVSPKQIAAGLAFGALVGLVPAAGLLPILLLIVAFLININLTLFFVAAAVFKLLSFFVDSFANHLGFYFLVKLEALVGLWTGLYNAPVIPFTRFNNTIVLGSLLMGLLLFVPLYFAGLYGVQSYRKRWREKILKLKIVQIFKSSKIYRYYQSYKGITQG